VLPGYLPPVAGFATGGELGPAFAAKAASNFNKSFANAQPPFDVWTETPTGGTPNFLTGAGGALQAFYNGYTGLRVNDSALTLSPSLPELAATVQLRGVAYLGARLDIPVEGCNFPGHFLARVWLDDQLWLVDCFNRGRFMLAADVARHHPAANPAMEELVHQRASVGSILMRFLRNLDDAFDKLGQMPERQLMRRLAVKMMDA
jgi:hypothetical protein